MRIIEAVKQLCSGVHTATKQHLDSKKPEVVDFARAKRTCLAGAYGKDHLHNLTFYGFRLHARVDDAGRLGKLLIRAANEHGVTVAPRLRDDLDYTVITADKGYISKDLKRSVAPRAVDLVTPRRKNQLPLPKPEQTLYHGHRIIETTFSSLDRSGLSDRDRSGLSDRPYRSTIGFVLHVYTVVLAYQLHHS